jgi:hypothetical protein
MFVTTTSQIWLRRNGVVHGRELKHLSVVVHATSEQIRELKGAKHKKI